MKRILTLVVAVLCSAVIFAQADYSQHLIKKDFTKVTSKTKIEKPNKTRDGEIWSCTFEESTPRYTVGQVTPSEGNWELQTKSSSNGNGWYYPLNSTNPNHPYGDLTDSPEHWMMIEAGNAARQGFDFDSYILFTGIDLSESLYPQLSFYEYRCIFNITPEMEGTIIEVSTNGGSSWTKHVVGCEDMDEYGFYYRRVPIFEAGGFEDVAIRFRAKRSESLIQSTFGVGYNRAQFIVHWQVDDVVIEEAAPFDFVITDVRMNNGVCDMYSNSDYTNYNPARYQVYPMFGQTPVSQWTSPNMFASFNVAVENRGSEPAIPIVTITITNPNGEEIWTVDFEGEEVDAYGRDTIDVIDHVSDTELDKVFFFNEEQMQNIVTGRYTVTYSVSTEAGDDPTPSNNTTTKPFYITEEAFSPATPNITSTTGPNNWSDFADGDEIMADFEYYVLPAGEIPVYVYISANTQVGTAIAVNIYEVNEAGTEFEMTTTSGTYTIQEGDRGSWINIPLETPLELTEFDEESVKYIRVGIAFFENGLDTLHIGASTEMPNKGWINAYNLGGTIHYYNVSSDYAAPAICLGNPNPEVNYTITVNSADEEMGTATGGGEFPNGTEIQISATPNDGYYFTRWNDGSTANPRTITVRGNATYTAYFEELPTEYEITVLSNDDEMGTATGGGVYYEGERVTLYAVANDGYMFLNWDDGNEANPRTITVTGDATYTAIFGIIEYTITVLSNDEQMGTVTGGGTYPVGTEITITATANDTCTFVQWNDGNTDNPRTITVTGDATYTAIFASGTTAVEDNAISAISIYPNPTSGIVNFANVEDATIEIYNMMGQVVASMNNASSKTTIDLSGVANGNYVVRILKNGEVVNSQINIVK